MLPGERCCCIFPSVDVWPAGNGGGVRTSWLLEGEFCKMS